MKIFWLFNICIGLLSSLSAQNFKQNLILSNISTPQGLDAYDIDNNGLKEIVSALYLNSKVALIKGNNGSYNYTEIGDAQKPYRVEFADFNKDGKMDILAIPSESNGLNILKNNDNQNFSNISVGANDFSKGRDYCIIDIDKDGDLDILVSSYINDYIALFELTSPQNFTFTVKKIDTSIDQASEISTGDFDKNGYIDFVCCSRGGGYVNVYLNSGNLSFQKYKIGTEIQPIGNGVGDFNSDGYLDIAISAFTDKKINVYLNSGDGKNYTIHTIDQTVVYPSGVEVGDVNKDGKNDIIIGYDKGLKIYQNNFENNTLSFISNDLPAGYSFGHFKLIDFDSDGDLDILASATAKNEIYEFRNETISKTNEVQINNYRISPNPTTDYFEIDNKNSELLFIEIFSSDGEIVLKENYSHCVDISNLNEGMYFIRITNLKSHKTSITKLFKMN